ncbi:MAG: tetratricopeptide repeat protein [Planctomycetaceae bacterium]
MTAALAQRFAHWNTLVELQAPFEGLDHVFAKGEVREESQGLRAALPVRKERTTTRAGVTEVDDPVVELLPSGSRAIQLDASFGSDWLQSNRIGLVLNRAGPRHYGFTLTLAERSTGDDSSRPLPATFHEAIQTEWDAELTLRKNGVVVQQVRVPASSLSGERLTLMARREGSLCTFQVNALEAVTFDDVFSISEAESGRFGIDWPRVATLRYLRVQRLSSPAVPGPFDRADSLLSNDELVPALDAFEELARVSKSADEQAEAHFKAGVCLTRLRRLDEAAAHLTPVANGTGDRWPMLAGCQLWVVLARQKKLEDAEQLFQRLSQRFSFESLAGLVPLEQRQEVLKALVSDLNPSHPEGQLRLQRFQAVDRFLSRDGKGSLENRLLIAKALDDADQTARAYPLWKELLADYPRFHHIHYRLAWAARVLDRSEEALIAIRATLPPDHLQLGVSLEIGIEEARLLAALGRWPEALEITERVLRLTKTDPGIASNTIYRHAVNGQVYLLLGFLQERLGHPELAQQAWRRGFELTREAIGTQPVDLDWTVMNSLVMGSLSNGFEEADFDRFATQGQSGSLGTMISLATPLLGKTEMVAAVRGAWQRPVGRREAERVRALVLEPASRRKQMPIPLFAAEYIRQNAFEQDISLELEERLHESMRQFLQSQGSNPLKLLGLLAAWRGQTNDEGLRALIAQLPETTRGMAALVATGWPAQAHHRQVARWWHRQHVVVAIGRASGCGIGTEGPTLEL